MSSRLHHSLALAAALSATGLAVVALTPADRSAPTVSTGVVEHAVLLPTIVVHPEVEAFRLPTITVRPTRAERRLASVDETGEESALIGDSRHAGQPLRASGGLAMPYYSFGKPAPRLSKE